MTLVRVRLIPREGELGSTETSRSMETIVDKVRCFGGHVAELGSTSVIAAFGLDPLEDAPRHAVSAAMAIQKVVGSGGGNPAWYPTVTIHTAPVPVGRHSGGHDIDAEAKPALVAVLEALAARTEPGTVVLSGEAAHFLGRRFELRHLTSTDVGQAYHVVGPIDTERRVATSFVGREAELGLLQERFRQAKTGHGQIVSVVGEPGIGKSRLLGEFRRQLAGEGTWMEGQASSVGRMIGLHPLVDLLRRTFRIEESDPDGVVVDKIEHGLVAVNEDLRPTIGFVRYLLSLDPGDPAIGRLDPQLRRASIFEAMQRFFARTAETRPLVIVWEDLHWADQATEELVVQLADSLVAHRILMIITGRPGYIPPASHRTFHTRLALSGLSPAHSVAMARALMSVDEVPARLQALLSDRAEGNPFFLEELLHSFQETGAIRRDGDDVILAANLETLVLPATVQDVILARIERLSPAPRHVLDVAAVIGREFARRVLDRLAGSPESTAQALRELAAAELIHEQSLRPEPTYRFRHAVTHEVAYDALGDSRRTELRAVERPP